MDRDGIFTIILKPPKKDFQNNHSFHGVPIFLLDCHKDPLRTSEREKHEMSWFMRTLACTRLEARTGVSRVGYSCVVIEMGGG